MRGINLLHKADTKCIPIHITYLEISLVAVDEVFSREHKASALEGALGFGQQSSRAQDYAGEEDPVAAGQHRACQLKGQVSRIEPLPKHRVEVYVSRLEQTQTIFDINREKLCQISKC